MFWEKLEDRAVAVEGEWEGDIGVFFLEVGNGALRFFGGYCDHCEVGRGFVLLPDLLFESWDFVLARDAPRAPDVDDDYFAELLAKREDVAGDLLCGDGGHGVANYELGFGSGLGVSGFGEKQSEEQGSDSHDCDRNARTVNCRRIMNMFVRSKFATTLAVLLLLGGGAVLHAQDSTAQNLHRGRKYKAPPDTTHIEVIVTKESNGKPLALAAVVFHPVKDGKDEGNLEVKTNDEGKAIIDVIPTGSNVGIQVIADGYATFAGDFLVKEDNRTIEIKMIRPRAQISTYVDADGKASQRPAGVQEPSTPRSLQGQTPVPHPATPPPTTATPPTPPPAL